MRRKFGTILKSIFLTVILTSGIFLVQPEKANATANTSEVFCDETGIAGTCYAKNSFIIPPQTITQNEAILSISVGMILDGTTANSGAKEDPEHDVKGYIAGNPPKVSDEEDLGGWSAIWDENLRSGSSNGIHIFIGTEIKDPNNNTIAVPNLNTINSDIADGNVDYRVVPKSGISSVGDGINGSNGDISIDGYIGLKKRKDGDMLLLLNNNVGFGAIRITSLEPGKTYYARMVLRSSGTLDIQALTKIISFTTPTTGSATIDEHTALEAEEASVTGVNDPTTGLPGCGVFGEESSIMGCVGQIAYYILFKPTTWIMILAGEIMDWGIGYSISNQAYKTSGQGFVADGWKMMRDLSNVFFIFILVYIAITIILGKGDENKRFIVMVIIVALVINFSLFLTKVVVDFGNISSRFIYSKISVKNTQTGNEITGATQNKSISYGFTAVFNPLKLFKDIQPKMTVTSSGSPAGTGLTDGEFAGFFALFSLVGAVVNLIAAFVFFSLAWLFIGRTAGLWLAMIASPLAFLSLALPGKAGGGMEGQAKKYTNFNAWWGNLTKLAVMPFIALVMIFLVLTFISSNFLGNLGNEETTIGKFMLVLVPLMIISFLLLQIKKMAESMSGDFGQAMGKVGSFVGGAALGVATGGAALAGRRVLGGAGSMLAKNEALKKTRIGRNAVAIGRKMETATYDFKNTKLAQYGAKEAGFDLNTTKKFGLDTNVKTGYKEFKDNQAKKMEEYKESMKLGKDSEQVIAVDKVKKELDDKKESKDKTYQEQKEAKRALEIVERQFLAGKATQQQVDEAKKKVQDKEDAFKKSSDEFDQKNTEHKAAKKDVAAENAKILGSIIQSKDGSIGESWDQIGKKKTIVGKTGAFLGATADTVFKPLGALKKELTGSVSGHTEKIQEFREELKKLQKASAPATTPSTGGNTTNNNPGNTAGNNPPPNNNWPGGNNTNTTGGGGGNNNPKPSGGSGGKNNPSNNNSGGNQPSTTNKGTTTPVNYVVNNNVGNTQGKNTASNSQGGKINNQANLKYGGPGNQGSSAENMQMIKGIDDQLKKGNDNAINITGQKNTPQEINISGGKINLNVGGGTGSGEVFKRAYQENKIGFKPEHESMNYKTGDAGVSRSIENKAEIARSVGAPIESKVKANPAPESVIRNPRPQKKESWDKTFTRKMTEQNNQRIENNKLKNNLKPSPAPSPAPKPNSSASSFDPFSPPTIS